MYNEHNEESVFPSGSIELVWDETDGLTHINARPSGGLDLEDGRFREHNIGINSGLITGAIAVAYFHELMQHSK